MFCVPCCDVRIQTMFGSSLPPLVCRRFHVLLYFCVCLYIVMSNVLLYKMVLCSAFRVVMSAYKRCSVRLGLQLFVGGLMSYLRYFCLFVYSGVQRICCFLFCLSSSYVLCTQCFQFLQMYIFNCPSVVFNVYLKILKEQSESVNRRRTDKTMTKIKRTKRQTTIYKALQRKLKIEQHEPLVL